MNSQVLIITKTN